jgi:hypothetical protein
MINERGLDILMVEVESAIEKLLAEYTRMWVGDRDGNLYVEEGRQPIPNSEEVQPVEQAIIGG